MSVPFVLTDKYGSPKPAAAMPVSATPRRDGISGWNPPARGPETPPWERRTAVARAREMVETDGFAAGAITKQVDAIVGHALRVKYKPNLRALGLSREESTAFVDSVQALWEEYANDPRHYCDKTRHSTFGGLMALAFRHYLIESDALVVMGWDEARPFATTIRVVDPDLLSNPRDRMDSADLRGGIEIDEDGASVAYHFRGAHERQLYVDAASREWTRIEREDAEGCPIVIHHFDRHRDGQTRGRSNFDTIIEALRMEDKHARVELQAAVLDAVMAPYIKTSGDIDIAADMFGNGEVGEYLGQRSAYYEEREKVEIDGVRVHRLFPTDEMGVSESRRPAQGYSDFAASVLRRIASGLGITYEQLSADWSKTNYSSARAALNEIWRSWSARREQFVQGVVAPIFGCWFEEVVARGWIVLPTGAPDFHAAYPSWTRIVAIGPGKGFIDPVKEAQAARSRIAAGLSTIETEAAELTGADYHDTFEQLSREQEEGPEGFFHPAFTPESAAAASHNGGPPMDDDEKDPRS